MLRSEVKCGMVLSSMRRISKIFKVNGLCSCGDVFFEDFPYPYQIYGQSADEFDSWNWSEVTAA